MELEKHNQNNKLTTANHYQNSIVLLKAVIRRDGNVDPGGAITLSRHLSALTVEMALESPNRIKTLEKNDSDETFDLLNNIITITNLSLNVAHKLTAFQVLPIIEMIRKDFNQLTLEEIQICFREGIKGRYGPTMHRFDIEVATQWLDAYCENERWAALEKKNFVPNGIISDIQNTELLQKKVDNIRKVEKGEKPDDGFVNPNYLKSLRELREFLEKKPIGNKLPRVLRTLDELKDIWKDQASKLSKEELTQWLFSMEQVKPSYHEETTKIIKNEIEQRESKQT